METENHDELSAERSAKPLTLDNHKAQLHNDGTGEVSGLLVHTREPRIRKLTEKGAAYQIDACIKNFKSALRSHKHTCEMYKRVLESKNYDSAKLIEACGVLENSVTEISVAYYELGKLSEETQNEFRLKFEQITTTNRDLLYKITHSLRVIENINANEHTASGHHKTQSHHRSESKSGKSGSSRSSRSKGHSGSSTSSHSSRSKSSKSSVASMKLQAAAKAAALHARLEFHDVEAEHKSKLSKLTLMRDIAVEEAKLKVISNINETDNVLNQNSNSSNSPIGGGFNAMAPGPSVSIPVSFPIDTPAVKSSTAMPVNPLTPPASKRVTTLPVTTGIKTNASTSFKTAARDHVQFPAPGHLFGTQTVCVYHILCDGPDTASWLALIHKPPSC